MDLKDAYKPLIPHKVFYESNGIINNNDIYKIINPFPSTNYTCNCTNHSLLNTFPKNSCKTCYKQSPYNSQLSYPYPYP